MTLLEKKQELLAAVWDEYVKCNYVTEIEFAAFADALLEEVAKTVCPYCSPSKRWQPATFSEKFRDWVHIIGACEGEVPCSASAIRSGKGK